LIPSRDPRIRGAFDLDKPLYTISVASEILENGIRGPLMMYEDLGLIEPYRTAPTAGATRSATCASCR